jgi:hypothetical protein
MTKIEAKRAVSPADLLKAAVTSKSESQPASPPKDEAAAPKVALAKRLTLPTLPPLDPRRLAVPGAALAVGALLGGGVIAMARSPACPTTP